MERRLTTEVQGQRWAAAKRENFRRHARLRLLLPCPYATPLELRLGLLPGRCSRLGARAWAQRDGGSPWRGGSGDGTGSATLGTSTMFAGNILALDSITLNTTADILCGRAIALNAAVTMDTNRISNNNTLEDFGTLRSDFGSQGFSGGTPVPIPPTMLLLGSGLIGLGAFRLRKGAKKA